MNKRKNRATGGGGTGRHFIFFALSPRLPVSPPLYPRPSQILCFLSGRSRMRLPVAADTALQI
ncbi:MAG TPA: hypothetical protein VI260_15305, partial [Blastocatellia bacterium]